jgi:hypothetical protein
LFPADRPSFDLAASKNPRELPSSAPPAGWLAHALASGRVYPNFPDPGLDDWATAYHGGNAERLRAVKRRYDPDRLFRFAQAI